MADLRDYKNKDFSITVNTRMNGIELRFENTMTEEQIEQIKEAGFKWSKRQQMWYAYQNEKTIAYAKSLESNYEATLENNEIKQEKTEPSQVEQTVLLQDLIAELREEIRKQNERIKELEEIIEEKNNENEEILLEAENGEKMTIEELYQWNEEQEMQEKIDDLQEGKNFISSLIQEETEIILTEEDLDFCRKIIPPNQYAYTLELTQGEEGDFYKQKLKDIAKIAHKMTTNDELVNEDGSHNVAFHYFVGNTDFYISQLYPDGTAFGYTILNGDVEMAEWGYQNIEEIINVSQWIEMDYHVPEGMTIERMLEENYPEYYKQENDVENEQVENKFIPSFNLLNEEYAMEFEPARADGESFIVNFYDVSKVIPGENDRGQFIQSYYASTLQNTKSNVGLNLGYGWRLDAETFEHAKELINSYILQNENIIQQEESEIENDKEYARELADWLIQYGLENSESQENCIVSYDVIIENTNTTIEWLNKNYELVNEALAEHNNNELLEYDPEESSENDFNLYFCSNATEKGVNTLFKQNKNGRWVRKTDEELELELQEESELENDPVYTINGIEYLESEIEAGLREDIRQIFQEYDAGEIEENLVLNNVKLYKGENIDQLSLLVEYDSKNPNNKWTEDALFNALAEESISFAGMKVDINPITPEKSGTIEEYLNKLDSIKTDFENVANKVFETVTKQYGDNYKEFYDTYEILKEQFIENENRYVGDARVRESFKQAHNELVKLQVEELDEIIKQSENLEIAKIASIRYFNAFGNDGLTTGNLYLSTGIGSYSNGRFSTSQEKMQEYIENRYSILHEKNIHQEPHTKKEIKNIREQCREILQKSDNEITEEDKLLLAQYEGGGGINEENRTSAQVLNEFYTPNNLIEKVWNLVDAYHPNGKTVLEPTAGIGKFANNRPNNQFTMHELDETSARINKILHPEANVIQGAYQKQFLDETGRVRNPDFVQPKYDIVIGNPPYGEYSGQYKAIEGKHHQRYEEYFIEKGLDALKDENSILAYVVPSGFLDSKNDKQKELIASKGQFVDAYRLPAGTFSTTDVGTDILIMRSWNKVRKEFERDFIEEGSFITKEEAFKSFQKGNAELLSNGEHFKDHPEKILGEIKQRTNQFGKLVDTVVHHEGLSIQDELNKIDDFVSGIKKTVFVENQRIDNDYAVNNNIEDTIDTVNQQESFEIVDEELEELEVVQEETVQKIKEDKTINIEDVKQKPLAPVMTSEEFSKLYGKDFTAEEIPIWQATNWEGIIDTNKLSFQELNLLHESDNYVEIEPSKFTHRVLFESGDIGAKIEDYKARIKVIQFHNEEEAEREIALYENNIAELEKIAPNKIPMERLHFGLNSTLAEEFMIEHINAEGDIVKLNLQESFILWAKGQTYDQVTDKKTYYSRGTIDFATANISQDEFPQSVTWYDIVEYIDKKPVKADKVSSWNKDEYELKAKKAQAKREADEKRMARSETADKLFDRYLHEGLSEELSKKVEAEYNRRFNSYIIPDYSKLPLFIDGMSRTKNGKKFKLYDQQIKGVSFLCNKGNGLLAYDVGVGKTAAGIVATVNQIQTGRSKRPVIVVPNAVYAKWYNDICELFPNIKVNDLYNLNKESTEKYRNKDNPHKLDIEENSISLITYEGLKNITFTDQSCENELFDDFSKLLSTDFDGTSVQNAKSADNIKAVIGHASQVKNANFVFFEDCGFDNITVDEAHNFKNLWTVPRARNKGESNEFAGIPSGKPSARALKLFAMTQYTQRHNDDRNVFLLTATPFTNSPLEVYSMLSYVGRKRLIDSGLYSLRDFCNQFAHTKLELGVNSKGEIDQKQVMKDWKELPALQKILTEFIDKVDGEELKEIIRPKKFTHVQEIELSPLQKQMMKIDTALMNEVSEGNAAAVIVSMNAMRLALVAPALADPARYEGLKIPSMEQLVETSPKLKFVCDSVIDMYKNHPKKGQFIYMPLGQTAHGIVKDYLIAHGIPKETVEIINGSINNTTEKKDILTQKFNDPKEKCKILIGGKNTSEGIDLNGNSFVMYNCSLGWNPSETIQAEGRIWRQGNQQGHTHCVYPVMNDSIDSLLYQKHDEKRSRINELWTYKDGDTLNVEDINPEDLKFELIKDPQKRAKLILENGIETEDFKFTGTKIIQNELNKVNSRISSFEEVYEKRIKIKKNLEETEFKINRLEKSIEDYKKAELDVPSWTKADLKDNRKYKTNYEHQLETIERKFASWGIKSEEEIQDFIPKLNSQKHELEKQLDEKRKELPKILLRETIRMAEKKISLPSIDEQRKLLTEDIQKNLRPMIEVEPEIRTERFEQMLNSKWEHGEISAEEKEMYSKVGYKKYYEWLDGERETLVPEVSEIESVEEEKFEIKEQQQEEKTVSSVNEKIEKTEKYISSDWDVGLFPEDEIEELSALSKSLNPKMKNHKVVFYDRDSGVNENTEYETLSDAQKSAKKQMNDWELNKAENGFVVFNTETKQIEVVHGYFPVEKYFSSEILQANGYKANETKEIQLSKIQDSVKEKLSEEASKEPLESHEVFATPEKAKKEYVDSYEW